MANYLEMSPGFLFNGPSGVFLYSMRRPLSQKLAFVHAKKPGFRYKDACILSYIGSNHHIELWELEGGARCYTDVIAEMWSQHVPIRYV